jgi:hypothetical protein
MIMLGANFIIVNDWHLSISICTGNMPLWKWLLQYRHDHHLYRGTLTFVLNPHQSLMNWVKQIENPKRDSLPSFDWFFKRPHLLVTYGVRLQRYIHRIPMISLYNNHAVFSMGSYDWVAHPARNNPEHVAFLRLLSSFEWDEKPMFLVPGANVVMKMQKYIFQGDHLAAIFQVRSGRNLVEM